MCKPGVNGVVQCKFEMCCVQLFFRHALVPKDVICLFIRLVRLRVFFLCINSAVDVVWLYTM